MTDVRPEAAPVGADPVVDARPRRQEQEPASDEVVEVAPGVLRMQLPIQFTGLGHVNMYGLVDDRGLAVVDPGMPGRRSWGEVVSSLRRAGFRVRDVHTVVVTHSHPDHFGGASRLADEAGAAVVAHASFSVPWLRAVEPDVVSLDDDLDAALGVGPRAAAATFGDPSAMRVPWRAPGDTLRPPEMRRVPAPIGRWLWKVGRRFLRAPSPSARLGDGDHTTLGGRQWVAVHTPGHTVDHLCLYDPEGRILLSGDHVLPTITPHIDGMAGGHDPLSDYLDALARVAGLDVGLVLPAHGHPFSDLPARTAEIARHHQDRLDQLAAIAAAEGGATTVESFARQMFPERHRGLMAESEVFAHLEHLRRAGAARASRRDDGVLVYDIVPDPPVDRVDHP